MDGQLLVGLASTGVAALTIGVSAVTTMTSLRVQRDNVRSTLDAQQALARQQEDELRERTHSQELRDKRLPIYSAIIEWADALLAALDGLSPQSSELELSRWHVERPRETEIDLFASDAVHMRFTALRALLLGITQHSGTELSPLITWTEAGGRVSDVVEERTPELKDWNERDRIRSLAMSKAIDLVASIRAEMQGSAYSGYFFIYRLDRK